jgi:hypothetical protein
MKSPDSVWDKSRVITMIDSLVVSPSFGASNTRIREEVASNADVASSGLNNRCKLEQKEIALPRKWQESTRLDFRV